MIWGNTRHEQRWLFLAVAGTAMVFALLTQHAWEDYWITYRASKNLATGQGLVYNVGERLHTFTSPLGVLLPAAASLLTLNRSDEAALWIFRLMSCVAFGGAAVLLYASLRRIHAGGVIAFLGAAVLATDLKSVDFTINGMETAFLLLFLAHAFWASFAPAGTARWKHLGFAWAGLMWTRPDSFIYIALLAMARWLFHDAAQSGVSRVGLLREYFKAGALCTALYLPWFAGAWLYYGSPVPHTIVAKSSVSVLAHTPWGAVKTLASLPWKTWTGGNTIEATFLPSYYMTGGWPVGFVWLARAAGFTTLLLWLLPFLRPEIRAASLVFTGAHVYLSYFPYFPFPWYLCPTTLLAYFALLGLVAQGLEFWPGGSHAGARRTLILAAGAAIAMQAALLLGGGKQVALMQRHIEDGNRRRIGEWLGERGAPGDRVFLEPLGYVGFFSGLKIYDWPGLSSREVVEAHRRFGPSWADLVPELRPEWLVLRPTEVSLMNSDRADVLGAMYRPVRTFDVRAAVQAERMWGRRLLEMDALFTLYRRDRDVPLYSEMGEHGSRYPGMAKAKIGDQDVFMVHAPGWIRVKIPRGAGKVSLLFGFPPAAYESEPRTDGARFQLLTVVDSKERLLHERVMDPASRVEDRALAYVALELPAEAVGRGELILRTDSGASDTKDWTCWSIPGFW